MSTLPKISGETMKLATFFSALKYEDLPDRPIVRSDTLFWIRSPVHCMGAILNGLE